MTALAAELGITFDRWTRQILPLATGVKAWKGGTAVGDSSVGLVKPGVASTTLLFLGVFHETVDNTSGGAAVNVTVNFIKEKTILWRANDGTIAAANLFNPCYFLDDQTVTLTAAAHSKAGTILAIDSVLGVAFEVEGV